MAIALVAAVFLASPWFLSNAGAAADRYHVIQTTDESHKLLTKTCEVCHKDADRKFFIVTAGDEKELDRALRLLNAPAERREAAVALSLAVNPHTQSVCIFCHVSEPKAGDDPQQMEFRTLFGNLKGPEAEAEVCKLCHPDADRSRHPKVFKSESGAADDLVKAGLKLRNGKTLCTTCHDMHDPAATAYSLRPQVTEFFKSSPKAYPHGLKASCLSCHTALRAKTDVQTFVETEPLKLCIRCHGPDHPAHGYGMASSDKTYPMDFLGFPLSRDGRLVCQTCHDEPCLEKKDPKTKKLLRGGPYVRTVRMCEKCHPKAGKNALNPHRQLDDKGKPLNEVCVFCHIADPWGGEYGPGNMDYYESPTELCTVCHDGKPHPSRNHLVAMDSKRLNDLARYQSRHKVELPLGQGDTITCFTCHNPHGKGILSGMQALGAGETKFLRIPSFAEICAPCHKRYD